MSTARRHMAQRGEAHAARTPRRRAASALGPVAPHGAARRLRPYPRLSHAPPSPKHKGAAPDLPCTARGRDEPLRHAARRPPGRRPPRMPSPWALSAAADVRPLLAGARKHVLKAGAMAAASHTSCAERRASTSKLFVVATLLGHPSIALSSPFHASDASQVCDAPH